MRQGQQSVFTGCLSQSQHWGGVGGINLTNFTVPKWRVCLRLVVQGLFGRPLGSVDPEQLLVGTMSTLPTCPDVAQLCPQSQVPHKCLDMLGLIVKSAADLRCVS